MGFSTGFKQRGMEGYIMQLLLPLDHEPCLNHQAKLMANEMVASGDCLDWYHAYECAWISIEHECAWNEIEENEQ